MFHLSFVWNFVAKIRVGKTVSWFLDKHYVDVYASRYTEMEEEAQMKLTHVEGEPADSTPKGPNQGS